MKSRHIYGPIIGEDELRYFINPVRMTLEVDKVSYDKLFKDPSEVKAKVESFYAAVLYKYLSSMSISSKNGFVGYYCSFDYVPHVDGYDFRFNPITFVNNLFHFYGIDKHIDYINLDLEQNRRFFIDLVRNIVHDNLSKISMIERGITEKRQVLIDLDNNIGNITCMYDRNLDDFIKGNVRPNDMLFYLAYKSLFEYNKTKENKYLVFPYEYYQYVLDKRAPNIPHKINFREGGRLWYDDFRKDYDRLVGKDTKIYDDEDRLETKDIFIGCEILRPGDFEEEAREAIKRERILYGLEHPIDFEKYENLYDAKIKCYSKSGYDNYVRGTLGLDGYVGFKYNNEYLIFDRFYQTDRNGIRRLLIRPQAMYALPSDRLELIKYPKHAIMEAKKIDERIERHYHNDGCSFVRDVERISTGPNVSTSTFEKELEKLSANVLVKRK